MKNEPDTRDLMKLIRNADANAIHQRLDELDGERDALKTLLRSIHARDRARNRHRNRPNAVSSEEGCHE